MKKLSIVILQLTKVVRSDNNQELYTYDGNGNMISKTDGDGYVTEYTYNSLDLVSHINYNDAKEVTYQYNKVGELVKMDDWLGTTTFEVDLLGQLKKVTDHKGKVVSYAYDAVGNQTSVTYPDETTVTKTYDAVYNLTKVTDAESQNYTYVYDDAGRVTKLTYPNGWVEDYTYDAEGNLLKTVDTDPFHGNKQSKKYEYRYDAEGNLVSEYKRDTTASNRALTTTYAYDGLNRVISAHEEAVGHNTTRTYLYDTLGNLIREEQDGCVEYKYNGFALDESKKCGTIPNSIGTSYWEYTYDGRGNLVSNDKYTRTTSGMAWQNEETYVYDETNHMVDAKNEQGERSLYTYNGLGLRVGRELIMQDNTHGYTDFHDETPSVETGLNKPEVAVESYVIDYTSPTFRTLTMEEEGGFDYRWVYGLDKLSVKITSEGTNWWGQNVKQDILKDYLHQDRLGSTTNLTDKFGRVVGRADYNEWGEITYKDALDITSAYRRIYPQLNYTGHDWDDVLEMYYAKARFYDPDAKRFVEIDPVKGSVTDPLSLVSYLYCVDNPLRWVDPLGLMYVEHTSDGVAYKRQIRSMQIALEYLGYLVMPEENGKKVAYGKYAGAAAGAVQLFKFNYGGDYANVSVDSRTYLKILNVYINQKYKDQSESSRKAIYDFYRADLIAADRSNSQFYSDGYYPVYQCSIPKNAKLSNSMHQKGVLLVTDYSTKDSVIRLDLTNAIDEMIAKNSAEVLTHRFKSYEEIEKQWKKTLGILGYITDYPDIQKMITAEYTAGAGIAGAWFIEQDGDNKDWDVKRRTQFEKQVGVTYLGQQTLFYYNGMKMNAENLGNYAYGYWATLLGFTIEDIKAGSFLEALGTQSEDTGDDWAYIVKGIQQVLIDYPQYVR